MFRDGQYVPESQWDNYPQHGAHHQHLAIDVNSTTAISMSEFEDFVNKGKDSIVQQFIDLKRTYKDTPVTITGAKKQKLNISHRIHPYMHNRVIMDDAGTQSEGDYINASYIVGYGNNPKAYIAAQAPKTQTVNQFWRMVWQNKVNRIVMLINVAEKADQKMSCPRYWPKNKGDKIVCGNYVLKLADITEYAFATVRAIKIRKTNKSRIVYHFLFNHWDELSTPSFGPLPLISLTRLVHEIDTLGKGPLLVHCRTGVGRTGMFIALDILLQQKDEKNIVDVYGCVKSLREQRVNMIQDEKQYFFLYDAMLEYIILGETAYDLTTLAEWVVAVRAEDICESEEFVRQFAALTKLRSKPRVGERSGLAADNIWKNRDSDVVPADCDRPCLKTLVPGRTDYINAVFVDSFRRRNQFIVTQMPLPDTQVDFWRLVYDYDIQCIVMLNQLDTHDERCKQYWDDQRTMTFGPISVQRTEFSRPSRDIACREFTVRLTSNEDGTTPTKTLTVTHYQLLNWPNNKLLPDDNSGFHSLLKTVYNWRKTRPGLRGLERNDTILVHCMCGIERSGIFCAVNHVIEQIAAKRLIDVLLAARFVCARRTRFFKDVKEYVYLYTSVCEYAARTH